MVAQRYAPLVGHGEIRYGLTRPEPQDNDAVYIRKSPDSQWAITRLRAAFIHALKVRPREV
jgi:hypothetical protein